jgi:hypothetical protein
LWRAMVHCHDHSYFSSFQELNRLHLDLYQTFFRVRQASYFSYSEQRKFFSRAVQNSVLH